MRRPSDPYRRGIKYFSEIDFSHVDSRAANASTGAGDAFVLLHKRQWRGIESPPPCVQKCARRPRVALVRFIITLHDEQLGSLLLPFASLSTADPLPYSRPIFLIHLIDQLQHVCAQFYSFLG